MNRVGLNGATVSQNAFGPVDLYLLGLPSEFPDPAALASLMELVDAGVLRLLDLILVSRAETGETRIVEVETLADGFDFDATVLGAVGLVGLEDIAELSAAIPTGASALLVAVELVYQRELATRAADSGATLLGYERIPAPIVNALADSLLMNSED